MPHSINGFGTAYYGECDLRPDGSYITTEWIVAAHLPVFPLRSFRLMRVPDADQHYVVYSSESYLVLETLPRHTRQVVEIYSYIGFFFVWLFAVGIPQFGRLPWSQHGTLCAFAAVGLVMLPFVVPVIVRRRQRGTVRFSEEALMATLKERGLLAADTRDNGLAAGSAMPPPLPKTAPTASAALDQDDDRYKPPGERRCPPVV